MILSTDSEMNRRTLLYALGAASITTMLVPAATQAGKIAVAKPGESRFAYSSAQQAALSPCKLTAEDSTGLLSIFELKVPSRSGPVRHVHRREDEWICVMSGQFTFEIGDQKLELTPGGSVWMPRELPHVWANMTQSDGKLLVACQPGGFERFFNELSTIPTSTLSLLKQVLAKYGMKYLGPPLFGPWRDEH